MEILTRLILYLNNKLFSFPVLPIRNVFVFQQVRAPNIYVRLMQRFLDSKSIDVL